MMGEDIKVPAGDRLFSLLKTDLLESMEPPQAGANANANANANTAADANDRLLALHAYYTKRLVPGLYVREENREELLDYVRLHGGCDLAETLRTADEVVNRTFSFRFRWDMERAHLPVSFEGKIDWQHVPDKDVEWAYMLNRHRYWIALGQAYWLTGNDVYARTFAEQLDEWIDANLWQSGEPGLAWRSIEAGLRAANWIKAFCYFKASPHLTPELLGKMLLSLYDHAVCLASQQPGWRSISNWGVLESQGLFALSLFLDAFAPSDGWREMALNRLKDMVRLQVGRDGWHWEQSPMYHNEVLHGLLDVLQLARLNGVPVHSTITETAQRMAYVDLYLAKPNGHQPMLGDSDDTDVRDLLTFAACLFEEGQLKSGGYSKVDYDTAWSFGMLGITVYEELESSPPSDVSHPFQASGNFVMRSDWREDAAYLFFHCAPIGGGHGHADLLHFDIHAYGKDLLTDLGRHNYREQDDLRLRLKKCSSHNTTTVDGVDFTECTGTWTYGRIARPLGVEWLSESGYDYVEGSHDGYLHLPDPVRPLRRILFIKPGYWVLCDSFQAYAEHVYEQYFHFPPGDIRLEESARITRTSNDSEANLAIIPVHPERLSVSAGDERISYVYNENQANRFVTYGMRETGFVSILQILYPMRSGEHAIPLVESVEVRTYEGEVVDSEVAEACRIRLPDSLDTHIVLICHRKPVLHLDSYLVEGIQVFGEVVLIKQGETGTEIITVK